MNVKRHISLVVCAVAVGVPATWAGAHGNNPKYGSADETLDTPPKAPPHAEPSPRAGYVVERGHSVVSARGGTVQPRIPDLRGDVDETYAAQEIDSFMNPPGSLHGLLGPGSGGPSPWAGADAPTPGRLLPDAGARMAQLPGVPGASAVPAPATLALLGLAAAAAGGRRRRT
jgi:hypothetical protein